MKAIKKSLWPRLLIFVLIMGGIAAIRLTGATRFLDQETLRNSIQSIGLWAPALYILLYTLAPVLFLPGLPITLVGGILFGPFWGVIYTIFSATAGACLAFLVARYVGRDWVSGKFKSPRWRKLDEGVERQGWKVVAFTRLIPLFPFNLLNYAFGLTKIGFIPYAVTSFICMLPACIAFIVFSSSLFDIIKGKISPTFIIGISLIIAVSLIPVFYRYYKQKTKLPDLL
ncbi:MAG: TVP38/TMEM64 family protein [Desulfobacterales bacterium]|nr:TVP38/TMEM64 family protein [Desulfobacterales bacterium]